MRRLAEGLYQLRGIPPNYFNVYLARDVLIDAGTRHRARSILRQIEDHTITAHALTHAHSDHQGSSKRICETLDVPLWCGDRDVTAMETGRIAPTQPNHWINRVIERAWAGPGHPVARRLSEGDEVADFVVVEVPGHSPGHVAYWRERDRALIVGDVVTNMNLFTGRTGLHEPLRIFTPDPVLNRDSMRKLAALEPAIVCFGHGPPLRDTKRFTDFVAAVAA